MADSVINKTLHVVVSKGRAYEGTDVEWTLQGVFDSKITAIQIAKACGGNGAEVFQVNLNEHCSNHYFS